MKNKVYLQWIVDIYIADHDGYCTDNENDDLESVGTIWCAYVLNNDEIKLLKSFNGNVSIFNNNDDITPYIPNDGEGVLNHWGSGYCLPSSRGLCHERERVPTEVVGIAFEEPLYGDIIDRESDELKKFLHTVQENYAVLKDILQLFLVPSDIIKLIWKHVWNIQ